MRYYVSKRRRSGKRFRLLIYERMWQRWAWPCILIIPASMTLWWFAPRIPILYAPFRPLTLVPALVSLAILAYTYLARRLDWVQCRRNHLRIQTPFYQLCGPSWMHVRIVTALPAHLALHVYEKAPGHPETGQSRRDPGQPGPGLLPAQKVIVYERHACRPGSHPGSF